MKFLRQNIISIAIFFLVFTIFLIKSNSFYDPDFGYRLITGETILNGTFPETDPYSFTMASFPYVEHAWIVGIFWAVFFPMIGYSGLSAISSMIALFSLYLAYLSYKPRLKFKGIYPKKFYLGRFFSNFLVILAIGIIASFVGVRAQVFGWVFFSGLVFLLFRQQSLKKVQIFLPLYFLIWTNVHGSFLAGLVLYSLWTVVRFVCKKDSISQLFILLASLAFSLINPYGIDIWREALSSATDISLRSRIVEWQPLYARYDLLGIAFATISSSFIYLNRKHVAVEKIVVFVFFLIQAMASTRNLPLFVFIALPMATKSIDDVYNNLKTIPNANYRFKIFYRILIVLVLLMFSFQIFTVFSINRISNESYYPIKAVEKLETMKYNNLFSTYNWGGYLVWNLPKSKTFIDGRMPSWQNPHANESELEDAMKTYLDMIGGAKSESESHKYLYQEMFDKFGVDVVLWTRRQDRMNYYERIVFYLSSLVNQALTTNSEENFKFEDSLSTDGWIEVYKDDVAVIYQKP